MILALSSEFTPKMKKGLWKLTMVESREATKQSWESRTIIWGCAHKARSQWEIFVRRSVGGYILVWQADKRCGSELFDKDRIQFYSGTAENRNVTGEPFFC